MGTPRAWISCLPRLLLKWTRTWDGGCASHPSAVQFKGEGCRDPGLRGPRGGRGGREGNLCGRKATRAPFTRFLWGWAEARASLQNGPDRQSGAVRLSISPALPASKAPAGAPGSSDPATPPAQPPATRGARGSHSCLHARLRDEKTPAPEASLGAATGLAPTPAEASRSRLCARPSLRSSKTTFPLRPHFTDVETEALRGYPPQGHTPMPVRV